MYDLKKVLDGLNYFNDELYGYDKEKRLICSIINNTMKKKHSDSILIVGPRGSGKSFLVNHCLKSCCVKHESVIILNGYIHSTDSSSLNFIANGLNSKYNSSSHVGSELQKILSAINKRYIFILEEFDVFCKSQQCLLYNLFDALQNVFGICIICLTTWVDCTELLEKRVKSRLKPRTIILTSPFDGLESYVNYAYTLVGQEIPHSYLKPLLKIQYQYSRTITDLKLRLTQIALDYYNNKDTIKEKSLDHKVHQLISLSDFELAIILLIYKKLSIFDVVRPHQLYPLLNEIPRQINHSNQLCIAALYNLMDYGLIVNKTNNKFNEITDFSPLNLNVDLYHIEKALEIREKTGSLPTDFKRLLTWQQ